MDKRELKKLLKMLFIIEKQEPGNPVSIDDLTLLQNIGYNELLSDVKYLKDDGYVELNESVDNEVKVKITQLGINKMENMSWKYIIRNESHPMTKYWEYLSEPKNLIQ